MHRRIFPSLVLIMVCLGIVVGSVLHPRSAAAGSNGQQVQVTVRTTCELGRIISS